MSSSPTDHPCAGDDECHKCEKEIDASCLQYVIRWLDDRRQRANIDQVANITAQFVPKDGESFYRDSGDDYLFALKENYETLRRATIAGMELAFPTVQAYGSRAIRFRSS